MNLRSTVHATDDVFAAQELFHARGWTDGLPVVPPTEAAVRACLDGAALSPDFLIGVEPVRARAITAEKVAVNAVMAGCLPIHFPVVVAVLGAMLREEFTLHGATASTGGCAVFIVVNGDARRKLGMDGTFNALGNSDRATAVIGRAVRLCLVNLFDVRPGGIDSLDPRAPWQVQLLRGRGRGGLAVGVAGDLARRSRGRIGGHRHGGGGHHGRS